MELHWMSALLFAVSCNADSLVAGLSFGMKKMPIRWYSNLIVGMISLIGTVLSMVFGKSILHFLPESLASILGCIIIMLIGAVGLIHFLIDHFIRKKPEETVVSELSLKKTIFLGFALTLNNAGLGIGASITGLPVFSTVLCSFLVCMLFLYLGNWIGRSRLSDFVGSFAEPLADLLMIGLGVYEIFY
ncbi:manganese efflux pump [Cuneatibacter sp. NSJ-177]|uniref:manganese efflux pump MntP n=1 Tax=Cuneatibacter sp. NSJ-177 TaxID=2931401 RepID=UPI001FD2586E|nr:manganese efflux pump [Cuneatibacter sp. NSJ-177]MCJ7836054.1 manganese efflux pump [Cuneatibacter sp. NSJ-177]